jgi:hypothetical protein
MIERMKRRIVLVFPPPIDCTSNTYNNSLLANEFLALTSSLATMNHSITQAHGSSGKTIKKSNCKVMHLK